MTKTRKVLLKEKPDVFLIYGDTNSTYSALVAKSLKIPVFHMEAGNRSFDQRIPEEINRKIIDHISNFLKEKLKNITLLSARELYQVLLLIVALTQV